MTTKEMLEFYDGLIEDAISSGGDYGEFPMDPDSEKQFRLAAEPIRIAIIERGPEVSRNDIEAILENENRAVWTNPLSSIKSSPSCGGRFSPVFFQTRAINSLIPPS